MGVIHVWPQMFGYKLTLQEFLWTYRPFALFREPDLFSLSARQGRRIIDKCPTSNKGWKTKFFHVSTLGLNEENPEGHRLPTAWAGELRGMFLVLNLHILALLTLL